MVIVEGTFRLAPGSAADAQRAALAMMRATAREAGCQTYRFSADLEEEGVFHLFEVWESDAALNDHFQTPHMAEFRAEIGRLEILSRDVRRYAVSGVSAL